MVSFTLRTATSVDAKAVAQLHIENWRSAYKSIMPDWYLDNAITEERMSLWESRLSATANPQQYVVIAETSGKAAGFACALLNEENEWGACLDNLHVLPHLRGSGIGRALFSKVAQWVLSTKPGWPLHLWVFEGNINARGFYESFGGKLISIKKKEILRGVVVTSCLYLWTDLYDLLKKIGGEGNKNE